MAVTADTPPMYGLTVRDKYTLPVRPTP